MSDVIALLKEAVTRLNEQATNDTVGRGNKDLAERIEKAMQSPELHIDTPKGELIVGIAENEATQAYVCMNIKDKEDEMLVDLFLAEVPGEELMEIYEKNENLKKDDIRMLLWEDVYSEDYTHKAVIKAEDMENLMQAVGMDAKDNTKKESIKHFGKLTENSLDELCAEFEALKYGAKTKVTITDAEDRLIMIEAERNFNPESFEKNISKDEYDDGYGDLYKINTSLLQKDGTCIELEEIDEVPITELYNEIAEVAGVNFEYDYEIEDRM